MKKILIATALVGFSLAVHAQGTVYADNTPNTGIFSGFGGTVGNPQYSSSVTANGLIFSADTANDWGSQGGPSGNQELGVDSSFVLVGGTSAGAVASITGGNVVFSDTGSSIAGDNVNWGQLTGNTGNANSVPTTTQAGTYFFQLFVWEGNTYSTYAAALGNTYTGASGVWSQATGGNTSGAPATTTFLTGLPDMMLTVVSVPEPTTLALFGLGGAALLAYRRRKA